MKAFHFPVCALTLAFVTSACSNETSQNAARNPSNDQASELALGSPLESKLLKAGKYLVTFNSNNRCPPNSGFNVKQAIEYPNMDPAEIPAVTLEMTTDYAGLPIKYSCKEKAKVTTVVSMNKDFYVHAIDASVSMIRAITTRASGIVPNEKTKKVRLPRASNGYVVTVTSQSLCAQRAINVGESNYKVLSPNDVSATLNKASVLTENLVVPALCQPTDGVFDPGLLYVSNYFNADLTLGVGLVDFGAIEEIVTTTIIQ